MLNSISKMYSKVLIYFNNIDDIMKFQYDYDLFNHIYFLSLDVYFSIFNLLNIDKLLIKHTDKSSIIDIVKIVNILFF